MEEFLYEIDSASLSSSNDESSTETEMNQMKAKLASIEPKDASEIKEMMLGQLTCEASSDDSLPPVPKRRGPAMEQDSQSRDLVSVARSSQSSNVSPIAHRYKTDTLTTEKKEPKLTAAPKMRPKQLTPREPARSTPVLDTSDGSEAHGSRHEPVRRMIKSLSSSSTSSSSSSSSESSESSSSSSSSATGSSSSSSSAESCLDHDCNVDDTNSREQEKLKPRGSARTNSPRIPELVGDKSHNNSTRHAVHGTSQDQPGHSKAPPSKDGNRQRDHGLGEEDFKRFFDQDLDDNFDASDTQSIQPLETVPVDRTCDTVPKLNQLEGTTGHVTPRSYPLPVGTGSTKVQDNSRDHSPQDEDQRTQVNVSDQNEPEGPSFSCPPDVPIQEFKIGPQINPEIHHSLYAPPAYQHPAIPPIRHNFDRSSRPSSRRMQHPVSDVFPEPVSLLWKGKFEKFNHLQSELAGNLSQTNDHIIVSAPTGAGKTAIFEMAMAKFILDDLSNNQSGPPRDKLSKSRKMVYIAPSKALCEERYSDWLQRLSTLRLGIELAMVTGDVDPAGCYHDLMSSHLILSTPEKWDSITRKWSENFFLMASFKLFMIDEVHLLGDDSRGSCLESIVTRMKTVQRAAESVPLETHDLRSSR